MDQGQESNDKEIMRREDQEWKPGERRGNYRTPSKSTEYQREAGESR
jgi:hypothetical protein